MFRRRELNDNKVQKTRKSVFACAVNFIQNFCTKSLKIVRCSSAGRTSTRKFNAEKGETNETVCVTFSGILSILITLVSRSPLHTDNVDGSANQLDESQLFMQ